MQHTLHAAEIIAAVAVRVSPGRFAELWESGRRTAAAVMFGKFSSTVHILRGKMATRVGTGCSGKKIFGPPNQSGKIFGRSAEFGWSLVVTNKANYMKNKVSGFNMLAPIFFKTTRLV